MDKTQLSRREFLKSGSFSVAGVVLAVGVSTPEPGAVLRQEPDPKQILNYNSQMHYRRLGKTNVWFSEVSLGGHWKNRGGGRFWGEFSRDEVPADVGKNRTEVVSKCIECGINYLDITTPAECCAYGVALKGRRDKMFVGADDYVLCPRAPSNRTVERQIENVEGCLRRLQTDYLDIWRPQMDMAGNHTDAEIDIVIAAFEKLHKAGKARFLGMSSHTRSFLIHVIETFTPFGMVIFPYTAKSKIAPGGKVEIVPSHAGDGGGDLNASIFNAVEKHDVGVVTIKPFGGGGMFRNGAKFPVEDKGPAEQHEIAHLTLQYILQNQFITATVPGMTTVHEVQNNVRASAKRKIAMGVSDGLRLSRAAEAMWASLPEDYIWLRNWQWV